MDQKYEETDLKFEETNKKIEILKVFEKSGNGSKYEETDKKFEESGQQLDILKVFENHLTINIGKRIQNIRKSSTILNV